jgi:hypothetical protein
MLHFANDIAAEHMKNVEAFADKLGSEMRANLDENLTRLCELFGNGANTRHVLYKDFAPASFTFVIQTRKDENSEWTYRYEGGFIFHGPHDGWGSGAAPTFSVTLNPEHGWSIHS